MYTYYADDIEISDNHRMSMTSDNKGVIRMAIENSTKDDEGTYRCKAENEEGIASTTGYVTITGWFACMVLGRFTKLSQRQKGSYYSQLSTSLAKLIQ